MPLLLTSIEGFARTLPTGPVNLPRLQLWKSAAVVGTYSAFGSALKNRALFEMTWRVAMVQANLAVENNHWVKSKHFIALDPSEKGSASYFLGLAQAHATCTRILGYSHLIHLDKLMKSQGQTLTGGRADLVGLTAASIVGKRSLFNIATVEAKGRTDGAPPHLRRSTKAQAKKISSLNATNVLESVASIAHFDAKNRWVATLVDPDWTGEGSEVTVEDALRHYYARIIDAGRQSRTWEEQDGRARFDVPRVGLSLSMPSELVSAYDRSTRPAAESDRRALTDTYLRLSRVADVDDDLVTATRTERKRMDQTADDSSSDNGVRWVVFRTTSGHYQFTLRNAQGRALVTSEEFTTRESALTRLRSLRSTLGVELTVQIDGLDS